MQRHFALCLIGSNGDQTADIQPRKVYEVLPDADAEGVGMMRIVDDSGEDYLYPASSFIPITLSEEAEDAFVASEVIP
jgi:hypothetical protein